MSEQEQQVLADAVVQLLRSNPKVRSALYAAVCDCPNLVVQY